MDRDDDKEFREMLEHMQLGELIDTLVCLRLEDNKDVDDRAKIKYAREEISRREVGRKVDRKSGKHGITTLDGVL